MFATANYTIDELRQVHGAVNSAGNEPFVRRDLGRQDEPNLVGI